MVVGAHAGVRHAPPMLAVLFCGLCVWTAYALWRSSLAPQVTEIATPVQPADRRPMLTADVALIAARHLFGEVATSPVGASPPPTRAALVLGGVWYTPDGDAYALIGEPGAPQKPYRTGNRLPGGIELAAVEADRVLLRRDGKVETLALPRAASVSASASAPRPVAAPRRMR
jgi:general secretion pathway protein C